MKRALILIAAGLVTAASMAAAQGGPPPYMIREAMPAGNRLAAGRDGAALFSNRCGACHLAGGMGTNLLIKQRLAVGDTPASALLSNRTDLTQSYVRAVVRNGKVAMPPLSRVEVTDAELDAITRHLGKAGQ